MYKTEYKNDCIEIHSDRISKFTECKQNWLGNLFTNSYTIVNSDFCKKIDAHLLSLYNFKGFAGSDDGKHNNRKLSLHAHPSARFGL